MVPDVRETRLAKEYTTYLRPIVRRVIPSGVDIWITVSPKSSKKFLMPSVITIRFTAETKIDSLPTSSVSE
jgi:hypothetical protein